MALVLEIIVYLLFAMVQHDWALFCYFYRGRLAAKNEIRQYKMSSMYKFPYYPNTPDKGKKNYIRIYILWDWQKIVCEDSGNRDWIWILIVEKIVKLYHTLYRMKKNLQTIFKHRAARVCNLPFFEIYLWQLSMWGGRWPEFPAPLLVKRWGVNPPFVVGGRGVADSWLDRGGWD